MYMLRHYTEILPAIHTGIIEIRLVTDFNILESADQGDHAAGVDVHIQRSQQAPEQEQIVQ